MSMRVSKGLGLLWVGIGIAVGCGEDGVDDSGGSGGGGTGGAAGAIATVPCDTSEDLDLTGTWAALARYSLRLESQVGGVVTMCPQDQSAPARLIVILDIHPEGGDLRVSATPCVLELPTVTAMVGECRPDQGNLLTVEIPIPALLTEQLGAIPPVVATGTLQSPDLAVDLLRFTWGTRQDALPSWESERDGCGFADFGAGRTQTCETACVERCEDVVDDDGDGYPGVTVHVCGRTEDDIASSVPCNAEEPTSPGATLQGQIAMAFRTELTLQGAAKSSCEASGTFGSSTTYAVVGADAYLTNTQVSVASALQSLPLFEGVTDASVWRMVRVDGAHGGPDWDLPGDDAVARCAVVRSRRNELE